MFTEAVWQRLTSLQQHTTEQLQAAHTLAQQTFEPELLAACRAVIDATLLRQPLPTPLPSERDQAFLALTEQFVVSVSDISRQQVEALLRHASADEVYLFVNALYVLEMTRRVELVAGKVLA